MQFRQVIDNLLKNAVEAMNGAGEIRITARRTPTGKRIEISDSGPGVPEEEADRIFEVFQTTKARGHGPGFGDQPPDHRTPRRDADIEASDSSNPSPNSTGATFVIELPDDDPPTG